MDGHILPVEAGFPYKLESYSFSHEGCSDY
jgi:hypothetical protein